MDRLSVLQKVADVLSIPVAELRGDDDQDDGLQERPEAFDMIRGALTGHPAIATILGSGQRATPASELDTMRQMHGQVWELVHGSRYTELAPILAALIPGLETAARNARTETLRHQARELLADTYQATAAAMSKLGEADAAWIAADRAAFTAEAIDAPLTVAASMFRMAHVFLSLGQVAQAQQVATATASALEPQISKTDARCREHCRSTGHSSLSSPSPQPATTTGARHTPTLIPRARSRQERERAGTTTEPNSGQPTSPSTPSR